GNVHGVNKAGQSVLCFFVSHGQLRMRRPVPKLGEFWAEDWRALPAWLPGRQRAVLRYRHFPAGGDIGEHTLDKAQAQLEEDFPPQACGRVPWAHKGMRLRCNRTAIKSIVEPEYRAARHALVHVHGPAHCIAPTM